MDQTKSANEHENVSVAHRIFKQQQASGSMEFGITAHMSLVLLQATFGALPSFRAWAEPDCLQQLLVFDAITRHAIFAAEIAFHRYTPPIIGRRCLE